ncbi:hypothetical protein M885DRAFT_572002 [Pelagophyceae sp. CCMP2097]|nr:hypothetical protein M885DRAFT_572002 [Pelagophyceae sp. CCMP2097]
MPCLIVGKLAGVVLLSLVAQSQSWLCRAAPRTARLTAAAGALSTTFEPTKAARAPPEIAAFAPSEDSDCPLLNVSSPAHPTFVLPEVAAPEAVVHAQQKGPTPAATAPAATAPAQPVSTAPAPPAANGGNPVRAPQNGCSAAHMAVEMFLSLVWLIITVCSLFKLEDSFDITSNFHFARLDRDGPFQTNLGVFDTRIWNPHLGYDLRHVALLIDWPNSGRTLSRYSPTSPSELYFLQHTRSEMVLLITNTASDASPGFNVDHRANRIMEIYVQTLTAGTLTFQVRSLDTAGTLNEQK